MTLRIIGEKPDSSFSVITVGSGDINSAESGCVKLQLMSVKQRDGCTEFIYFSEGFYNQETEKLN